HRVLPADARPLPRRPPGDDRGRRPWPSPRGLARVRAGRLGPVAAVDVRPRGEHETQLPPGRPRRRSEVGAGVKLGVIARMEPRGLGNQTYEVCRHLDPERVLLIDVGRDDRFEKHPERFDRWDVTVAPWIGARLDESTVRRWLSGLDVVYTAETPYDARLSAWCELERSEEHTSELQSRENLVCRLLLEKKKR